MHKLFLFFALLLLAGCSRVPETDPSVLLWSPDALRELRATIQSGGARAEHPAYLALCEEADAALAKDPPSITFNSAQPEKGSANDYFSVGLYFWPQEGTEDGLPWVARDGVANPAVWTEEYDAAFLIRFTREMTALSLVYYLSGEEKYAEAAVERLKVWFVDAETRMNPHLRYAQSVPGLRDGSRFGIIEGFDFVRMIDGLGLLAESPAYTEELERSIRTWLEQYLDWLLTSKPGLEERYSDNNHGTYMDGQLVVYAWWLGKHKLARRILKESLAMRVDDHIDDEGMQPREMRRTRTFEYHTYNLHGLFYLAMMGDRYQMDIWHAHGAKLQRALDYLLPYADPDVPWPYPETLVSRQNLIFLLRQGSLHFHDPKYEAALQRYQGAVASTTQADLLWPAQPVDAGENRPR